MKVEELQHFGGRRLTISEDGNLIATALLTKTLEFTSTINTIQIFDLTTQTLIRELEVPNAPVIGTNALAFSPDGSFLVAAGLENAVFVWDINTGELVYKFPFWSVIYGVSFSSDNKLLAATTPGERGGVVVWDLASGDSVEFPGSIPSIDVAFIPNSTTLAIALANRHPQISGEGIIMLWNIQSGETEVIFTGQVGEGIAVSLDGSILAAKVDGNLRLWDLQKSIEIDVDNKEADFGLVQIIFSKQETLAVLDPGNDNSLITIWNTEGKLLAQLQEKGILDIAFDPTGHLFFSKPDAPITIWGRIP
ncbi:MAG: hypothetical protein DWQ04_23825 [Chloroflexi bacterium]|nr:MAG: hypothetical protein DWQ04_23825 [Chloroflexota bacterium]